MDRIEFIKSMLNSKLFHGLSLDEMDELLSYATSKSYSKGDTVVNENDEADSFYFIESGTLEVKIAQTSNDNKLLVRLMKDGDIFGEMSLLGMERRTATVTAQDTTHVFIWNAAECLKFFQKNKEPGYTVMKNLSTILAAHVRNMNLMLRNYADALGPEAIKHI